MNIIFESDKEKQYLVGYRFNKPIVVWLDIGTYKETKIKGIKSFSFIEDGIKYTYKGNDKQGFYETEDKSPYITGYKIFSTINGKPTEELSHILDQLTHPKFDDEDDIFSIFSLSGRRDERKDEEEPRYYDTGCFTRPCGGSGSCGW